MAGGETPKIKTPLGLIWLDDGIAQVEIVKKPLTVKDVEGHTSVVLELSQSLGPVSMPVLVDLGSLERADGDALRATAVMLRPEWNEKIAFLVRNPLQKILASFLIGTGRVEPPAGIFESRNEAVVWLKSRSRKAPRIGKDAESKDRIQGIVDALADTLLTGRRMNIPVTRRDKTDALAAGLALLSEAFRESPDRTAAGGSADTRHVAELERMIEERTREIKEVNAKLSEEIKGRVIKEKELEESERKYRELADTLPQVVFEIDSRGIFSYVNEAGYELFGYSRDDLESGTPVLDMIDESDYQRVTGAIQKMMDGRSTGAVREYMLKKRDGSTFPARAYTTLIRDEDGRPAGVRGILTDISAELALKGSEQRFRQIFHESTIGNELYDADGQLIDVNRTTLKIFGVPDIEEVKGFKLFEDPNITEEVKAGLARGESARYVSEFDFEKVKELNLYRTSRAGTIFLDVLITPLTSVDSDQITGYIVHIQDITEQKLARDALAESEERFRDLFEHASDLIQSVNPDGSFAYVNRAWLDALEYSEADLENLNLHDVIHPESMERCMTKFDQVLSGQPVEQVDAIFVTKNGRKVFVEGSVSCRFEEGVPARTRGMFRDITERKRYEEELQQNLRFLQTLIDAMPNPVFVKDTEGVYTGCNKAFQEYLGRSREEIIGKTVFEMAPEDLARIYKEKDDELLQNPGVQVYEAQVTDASGNRRDMIFNKATFSRLDGSLAGLVGVILDITERKMAENDLRRVNAELDGFARTVSHDLKSSLTAISVGSQTLQELIDGPVTDEVRKDIHVTTDVITRGVQSAAALIQDLLALAEAGQRPKDIQEVGVRGVVERVLQEQKQEIEDRGIVVECDEQLGRVHASPVHVYQLFMNIIRNAIKHNDSPNPRIVIRYLGESGGRWRYRICDNGSGIPPEAVNNIFLPFYKGESGGTGIGLSTVEKIVKVYGGSIKVFNDGGACFEFSLGEYRDPV
jgi:PAS domain S-box-containing protein